MRLILLVMVLLTVRSEDVQDLGVVGPNTGIELESGTNRPDVVAYRLDFLPEVPPTNMISMEVRTNMLRLPDLVRLPSGPSLMSVRTVTEGGLESRVKLYRIDVRRTVPPEPTARLVHVLGEGREVGDANATQRAIERIRTSRPAPPPAPFPLVSPGTNDTTFIPGQPSFRPRTSFPGPLPGGTNRTYAESLDRMAEFYSKPGRRSQ